jgi:DnaJ-domain-containing protein 1
MGIINRLGYLFKSYLGDDFRDDAGPEGSRYGDPDFEAAFEELNDYLSGSDKKEKSWDHDFSRTRASPGSPGNGGKIPEELRPDFAELGLPFGAGEDDCKRAYKRLLKLHHPDRHAGHEGNMKKATEKSARINAAFDRIDRWRRTSKAE